MYISPAKVLTHVDRLASWKAGKQTAPVTVEWDLTNVCSLGCTGCHFAHTHVKGPWMGRAVLPLAYEGGTGDFADVALVKRGLRDMKHAGVKGIVWSGGGEPTLHPNWPEVIVFAREVGLEQGMYTLGGHLTHVDAQILAESA